MASSANDMDAVTYNTGNNPIAFKLTEEESLKPIPQPASTEEAIVNIWQRQMLIHFVVADKLIAFHGLYQDTKMQLKNVQSYFPFFTPTVPSTFEKNNSIDLKFMDPKARVFRSMPTPGNKKYVAWLNKVQNKRQEQWKMAGIFDAIQILRNAHQINPCMLLASMYFWEGSTNTFQLPCGMLKPTLFDVATITGF